MPLPLAVKVLIPSDSEAGLFSVSQSLPGALLGGLIIGLVEPFAARYVAAGYAQIAPYAVLILVLIFRPHGLFAQVRGKKL